MSLSRIMHVDDLLPAFNPTFYEDDGTPVDFSTASAVVVDCYDATGTSVFSSRSATGNSSGQVSMAWTAGDTDTVGELRLVVRGTWSSKDRSFPSEDGAAYCVVNVVSP